ncbi:MAG TPA: branched-chain amino acid transaminase [Candidatus Saccharimonadales bacterium]|nr:branched-chain amino acid transaminase [Candidatus Saccharimonadales bacterium]
MNKFDFQKADVYLRDGYVKFDEASLSIASSPVLYGLSVYTVFSMKWDEDKKKLYIFRLKDHYDRLIASAKILDFHQFAEEWSFDKFKEVISELLLRNNIEEDVLIRATVFIDELIAGTKIHGLKNSFSAYVYPMGEILSRKGVNACVSSWYRTPDNSIPSRAKINGSYVNASLMKNEALLNGYDEAIAVDQSGHVCEGTIANVFLVKDGMLITPPTQSDILEGITRNTVIQMADELGIKCEERDIDRSEIYVADELFFCGSSANVTPVLSVDKRQIGHGALGAVTKQIADTYEDIRAGKNKKFSHWLSEVNRL